MSKLSKSSFAFRLLAAIILCAFAIGIFSSCAPKVITTVLKSYPQLTENEQVFVFEKEKHDTVPANAEPLGSVSIVDQGAAKKGSYEDVVNMAVDATRKIGGNGLYITDHLKPSFWGSSIHQISGTMLRIHNENADNEAVENRYFTMEENVFRNFGEFPTHTLSLNGGYGVLTDRTEGLQGADKKVEKRLSNGLSWDIQYCYHHKGLPYGYGVTFAHYIGAPFSSILYKSAFREVDFYYAGMFMSWKKYITPKWIWGIDFGFGYLRFNQKLTEVSDPSNYGTITGNTLGMHLGMGINYRLSKHFGLGCNFSMITGSFSSVDTYNLIVTDNMPKIDSDNRLGANRINLTMGLRYYF